MVQLKSTPGSFKKPDMAVNKPTIEPKEQKVEQPVEQETEQDVEQSIEEKTEDMFEKLGIKFTEDDFTKLLFNGTYEAVIEIRPNLKVKLRTLQASDFNEVDEKLANMAKEISMTDEGYRSRFTLLVLSYGLLQINGKNVVNIPNKKEKPTDSEVATMRYEVLSKMAPAIINAFSSKHNALTTAINIVVGDSQYHLKNS